MQDEGGVDRGELGDGGQGEAGCHGASVWMEQGAHPGVVSASLRGLSNWQRLRKALGTFLVCSFMRVSVSQLKSSDHSSPQKPPSPGGSKFLQIGTWTVSSALEPDINLNNQSSAV